MELIGFLIGVVLVLVALATSPRVTHYRKRSLSSLCYATLVVGTLLMVSCGLLFSIGLDRWGVILAAIVLTFIVAFPAAAKLSDLERGPIQRSRSEGQGLVGSVLIILCLSIALAVFVFACDPSIREWFK